MDLHLGKLAWGEETRGDDYNADVAESMFLGPRWRTWSAQVQPAFKPAKFSARGWQRFLQH